MVPSPALLAPCRLRFLVQVSYRLLAQGAAPHLKLGMACLVMGVFAIRVHQDWIQWQVSDPTYQNNRRYVLQLCYECMFLYMQETVLSNRGRVPGPIAAWRAALAIHKPVALHKLAAYSGLPSCSVSLLLFTYAEKLCH